MQHRKSARASLIVIASLGMSFAWLAGASAAEGDKLDEAKASAAKAIAALREAPATQDARETHRKKAIDLLVRAHSEILKAKGE